MKISAVIYRMILVISVLILHESSAQLPYPLPAPRDTSQFGKYLQRTMKLLATSTPTQRNTVKILVYGQSIAKQEWSDTVAKYLRRRYPHANIIMINRSIGGCWAGCLQDPMEYDVSPFYPDLILFDVYGWNGYGGLQGTEYENIIRYMRTQTTAEIGMQNHHVTGTDRRNDNSDFLRLSNLYKVELIDVRTPWLDYLTNNSISNANDLTSDGTHLNDRGNFLMARLWLPYLQYKPTVFGSDSFGLVTTYKVGRDIDFVNGVLTLPFNGNRIDAVAATPVSGADSAKIFVDNRRPSTIPGTVRFTRPNDTYDTLFKHTALYDWPWQRGTIIKFNMPTLFNPKAEDWTLRFLTYNAGSNFTFTVSGTKTGGDGTGSANINGSFGTSGSAFRSVSSIVGFNADKFWFNNGPYAALPLGVGFLIRWQAKQFYTNTYVPPTAISNPAIDSVNILAQGIVNGNHMLVISSTGSGNTPIKEIRVYRPYTGRVAPNFTITAPNLSVSGTVTLCSGSSTNLTTLFIDTRSITGVVTYWQNSMATISVTSPTMVSVSGNYFIKKQAIVAGVWDIKTVTVNVITCQPNLQITNPNAVCVGGNANITNSFNDLNSIPGTVTYWRNAATTITHPNPATSSAPGVYFIRKTSTIGGFSDIKSVTVTAVNCQPNLTVTSPAAVCQGNGVSILNTFSDLNSVSGVVSFWQDAATTITLTSVNFVSVSGVYYIRKIGSLGGLSDIKTVTVTINSLPSLATLGTTTLCSGLSTRLTATGANLYNWMPGNLSGSIQNLNPSSTTIFSVLGTSLQGCTTTSAVVVSVTSLPNVLYAGANSICTGNSTNLTATGANTYNWLPGNLSGNIQTFNPNINTNYTLSGTNAQGCIGRNLFTITVASNPTVIINGNNTICTGNSTTLTATGTSTYLWLPGNIATSTLNVSPSSTTRYTITGSNGGSCSATVVVTVTVNALPIVTTLGVNQICFGGMTSITASGANTYTWLPGNQVGSVQNLNPTATTSYTAVGIDLNGCQRASRFNITVNSLPIITISGSTVICVGRNATVTASGANSYTWLPGNLNGSIQNYSPVSTQTNTAIGMNLNGCVNTRVFTVTVNSLPIVSVSGSAAICINNSANINASGANAYTWMPGNLAGAVQSVSPLNTTTYTVTGTDLRGCQSNRFLTVTVNSLPNLTISGNRNICLGQTSSMTVAGAQFYAWQPGGFIGAQNNFSPTTTTQYNITGTDLNGCVNVTLFTITVNSLPSVAINGNRNICQGSNSQMTATGANTLNWQPGNLNGAIQNLNPASTTTYTATGTNAIGCSSTAILTITVNSLPTVSVNGNANICVGSSSTVTASGANTYNWQPGNLNGGIQTFNPTSTTTYTASGTNASGCVNQSTLTIIVNSLPLVSINGNANICIGTSATLTASGANTFNWQPGNLIGAIQTFNPTSTTSFTATGTNASGCFARSTLTVTVNSPPIVSINGSTSICVGSSSTLTASGANTYNWQLGNLNGGVQTFNPTSTTTYSVTGSNGGSCANVTVVTITVKNLPLVTIAPSSMAVCEGGEVVLTASGATIYQWQGTNSSNQVLTKTVSANTNFSVVGTDLNNCTNSAVINIGVNPKPIVSILGVNTVCANLNAVLTASGALNYTWQPSGETTDLISVSSSITTVTLVGQNNFNCTATDLKTITFYTCTTTSNISAPGTNTSPGGNISTPGINTITGISSDQEHESMLFPNPTNGHINITYGNNLHFVKAVIRTVTSTNLKESYHTSIDLSEYPKGIYLIELQFKEKTIFKTIILN